MAKQSLFHPPTEMIIVLTQYVHYYKASKTVLTPWYNTNTFYATVGCETLNII